MKRGTITHPKTLELAAALTLTRYAAVGVLESLWHWTATYAFQGDIGRFSDRAIADGIAWDREADELISALVKCGWLDAHEHHRLVIHDWSDHADDAVRTRLEYNNLRFAVVKKALKTRGKAKPKKSRENLGRNSGDSPPCLKPQPEPSAGGLEPYARSPSPQPPPEAAADGVGAEELQETVLRTFSECWQSRYGIRYVETPQATRQAEKIADALKNREEAIAVVEAFFEQVDDELDAKKHPIGFLLARLPALAVDAVEAQRGKQ
jgi:hypothetical protein